MISSIHVQHFKNDSTNGWRVFDVNRFLVVGLIFGKASFIRVSILFRSKVRDVQS